MTGLVRLINASWKIFHSKLFTISDDGVMVGTVSAGSLYPHVVETINSVMMMGRIH